MDRARIDAVSPIVGVIFLVAVTVILAAIVLALLSWLPHLCDPFPRADIKILAIRHYDDETSALNFDSRVILQNTGTTLFENGQLAARFYCDDIPVNCHIETLHGHDFIPTIHNGVEKMWGGGCSDIHWEPNEMLGIDLRNRLIMPGQVVRLDIVDKDGGCVISRDWFRTEGPAR